MKVKYQVGSVLAGEQVDTNVRWLLVYDQYDQPLCAVEQHTDEHVVITTCADEHFNDVVRRYGINKLPRTEVVNDSP